MGAVYLATQLTMERLVALKTISTALPNVSGEADKLLVERFFREAHAVAQLRHPNIVTVHDLGVDEQTGMPFLAMEYVEGQTLGQRLRTTGPLSEKEAALVGEQVARALSEAHSRRIVHRDLKPANILLTRLSDGQQLVKVVDFGIAKLLSSAEPRSAELTQEGDIVGTPAYLSPEQARGGEITPQADLYALGCVLHTALTGEPPFVADERFAVLMKHVHEAAPALPDVLAAGEPPSSALRRLHTRLLEKAPEDRPQGALEVAKELASIASAAPEPGGAAPRVHPVAVLGAPFTTDTTLAPGTAASTEVTEDAHRSAAMPTLRWALPVGLAIVACAVAAVWIVASFSTQRPSLAVDTESQRARTPRLEPLLTGTRRALRYPALSPTDGRIAYSDLEDIWTDEPGGGKSRNLTEGRVNGAIQPAFSPDGRKLALASSAGELHVMPSSGGDIQTLGTPGFAPDWSPDGTRLVVATRSDRDPRLRTLDDGALFVVGVGEVATSTPLRTRLPAREPAWSPKGDRIAYAHFDQILTVASTGGAAVRVSADGPPLSVRRTPQWGPDGEHLYYLMATPVGTSVMQIPIDPASGGAAGAAQRLFTWRGEAPWELATRESDGALVAAVVREEVSLQLLDMRRSPPVLHRVIRVPGGAFPAFSPDGSRIAVSMTGPTGLGRTLLLIDSRSGSVRHAADWLSTLAGPRWVDASTVLLWGTPYQSSGIWSLSEESGLTPRLLSNEGTERALPVPSPQGDRVAVLTVRAGGSGTSAQPRVATQLLEQKELLGASGGIRAPPTLPGWAAGIRSRPTVEPPG